MVRFLHGGGVLSRIVFGESILTNRLPPPPSTCNYAWDTLQIARNAFVRHAENFLQDEVGLFESILLLVLC
jgi:hypothetical protein